VRLHPTVERASPKKWRHGVNDDGRREVLGMAIGYSEAEVFWIDFLRSLARRGLRGVKLVISDAHEGIKASVAKVFSATWLWIGAESRTPPLSNVTT
jgi:hypothetical protein